MAIVVNPHNEEEERVLRAFLDTLKYEYQTNEDTTILTTKQQKEIISRNDAFVSGKTETRLWEDVKKDLERVFR